MATAVQIQIKVDNSAALPGIDEINAKLKTIGIEGQASLNKASEGMRAVGGHTATSLDSVRLLSQEFGLRLPRAIEAMLSRLPAVTNALSSMLGVMAGIAAVQVFVHVAEEAYKAYEQYISLNAAADKFYETLKKTQQQDFVNTRSLETTQQRMGAATSTGSHAASAAKTMQGGTLAQLSSGNIAGAIAMLTSAHGIAEDGVTAQQQMVALGKVQIDQTHQQILAQIELNHAGDAALVGSHKVNAELEKRKAINAENRSFDRKQEMYYGNRTPGTAGAAEQAIKDAQATAEAQAQLTVQGREQALEVAKYRHQATEAGLAGEALYHQKMVDDTEDVRMHLLNAGKAAEIPAAVQAINLKYLDEMDARLQKQAEAAIQTTRTAQQSGLKGADRVRADHNNAIDRINSDRSLADHPEIAAQLRIAAKIDEDQKLRELDQQFTDHAQQLVVQRTDSQLNGFAKINAEAQRQSDELTKKYREETSQSLEAQKQLAAGIKAIQDAAAEQRSQLAQHNAEEDLRYDQQASEAEKRVRENGMMGWQESYRNAMAEIQDAEKARLARLAEDAQKEGLTWQEVARRRVDIERQAGAEVQQQNQEMQNKIAGTLQSAFTDPIGTIKSKMEEMMFQIIAQWVRQTTAFKGLFGNMLGGITPGGARSGGGGLGSMASVANGILTGTSGISNGHPAMQNESIAAAAGAGGGGGVSGGSGYGGGNGGSYGGGSGGGGGAIGSTLSTVSGLASTLNLDGSSGTGSSALDSVIGSDSAGLTGGGNSVSLTDLSSSMNGSSTAGAASGAGGAASTLGALGAVGMGAYQGVNATTNAFVKGDPLAGALGDASAGASIGMLAGPEGALIGAGVGAAVGLAAGSLGAVTGFGSRLGARQFYNKSILPQLNQMASFPPGGDWMSSVSQVNQTAADARKQMIGQFGRDAADWVNNNYMAKYVKLIDSRIETSAKGGGQFLAKNAAQFHSGGRITGFGDLATSGNEGFIHAMAGETVMNPGATSSHAPMLDAMNSGASSAEIAAMYLQASSGGGVSTGAPGGETHIHVHTLDTKTMTSWLRDGGAQMITQHQNRNAARYSGEGIGG